MERYGFNRDLSQTNFNVKLDDILIFHFNKIFKMEFLHFFSFYPYFPSFHPLLHNILTIYMLGRKYAVDAGTHAHAVRASGPQNMELAPGPPGCSAVAPPYRIREITT